MAKLNPSFIIHSNRDDPVKAFHKCREQGLTMTYDDVWKSFGIKGIKPKYSEEQIDNENDMWAAYNAALALSEDPDYEPGFFENHKGSAVIGALGALLLAITGGSVLLNNYMVDGKFCLDKIKFDYTGNSNSHVNATTSETGNGNVSADLNATLSMTDYGEINIAHYGDINSTTNATLQGILNGEEHSNITANIIGNVIGPYQGHILGFVNGTSAGDIAGKINGSVDADVNGTINGYFNGTLDEIKNLTGWFNGLVWDGSGFQAYKGKIDMSQMDGNKTKFIGYFVDTNITGKIKGKADLDAKMTYNGTLRAQVDAENNGTLEAMLNATMTGKADSLFTAPIQALLNGYAMGKVKMYGQGNVTTQGKGNAEGTVKGDISTTGKGNMDGSSNGSESGVGEFSSLALYGAETALSLVGLGAMANWEKDKLKGYFTEQPKKINESKMRAKQYVESMIGQSRVERLLRSQNYILEEQKKFMEELRDYKKEPVSDYAKTEPEQPKAEV